MAPTERSIADKPLRANDSHKDAVFPENSLSHLRGFTTAHNIKNAINGHIPFRQQSTIPWAKFVIDHARAAELVGAL